MKKLAEETKAAEAEADEIEEGAVESTDDLATEENKQAEADGRNDDADDEQTLAADETNDGLNKADDEDTAANA